MVAERAVGCPARARRRRPTRADLVLLVAGKAILFSWAFGVPLLFHPVSAVLVHYGVAALVLGNALAVVFQVAHCVGEETFPLPSTDTGRIEQAWAVHQAETTVDFARPNRVVAWLLGGLNFQIENHLFPTISHVNYPAISKLVEQTCRDLGVAYTEHRSLREGVTAHFRWLRRMGMPNAPREGERCAGARNGNTSDAGRRPGSALSV